MSKGLHSNDERFVLVFCVFHTWWFNAQWWCPWRFHIMCICLKGLYPPSLEFSGGTQVVLSIFHTDKNWNVISFLRQNSVEIFKNISLFLTFMFLLIFFKSWSIKLSLLVLSVFLKLSKNYQLNNICLNFFISLSYEFTDKKSQKLNKLMKKTCGVMLTIVHWVQLCKEMVL